MVKFMGVYVTPFLPHATKQLLLSLVPPELADIIVQLADDEPHDGRWDPYGHWAALQEPEYDQEGNYGSLPMVEVQVVDFWV